MTNNKLTPKNVTRYAQYGVDMMEWPDGAYVKYEDYAALAAELQERRKAAMDSEPVAEVCEDYAIRYISSGPAPKEGLYPGDKLYRHAQQQVVPNHGLITELLTIAKEAADDADAIAYAEFSDESMRHTTAIADWECRAAMLSGGKS